MSTIWFEPKLYPMSVLLNAAERDSNERPRAIGAFNINFRAQTEGVVEGLHRARAPGILQASKGACKFQGGARNLQKMLFEILDGNRRLLGNPLTLHLDHGDYLSAAECIANGFSAVMADFSTEKARLPDGRTVERKRAVEENAYLTRPIVLAAHEKKVSVEGEVGVLAGVEEDVSAKESIYPTLDEIMRYVELSGVDAVAIACGTCHGPVKNFRGLEHKLLREAYRGLFNLRCFAVLHGSSTIPRELVEEINEYGGTLKNASGIPMAEIKEAISDGVRKVNIDTDLRLGITATVRKFLHDNPNIERDSPAIGLIKSYFTGEFKAKDKDGNAVAPGELVDPRSYLEQLMKEAPEMLRGDYRALKDKDEAYVKLMDEIKERVAGHVEFLAREFGSAGLAGGIDDAYAIRMRSSKDAGEPKHRFE